MASPLLARYTLVFYAPPSAVAACKAAIFRAGAGRYPSPANYSECCWSTSGTGQFRPGHAAKPHIGRPGALEETPEVRVETLCVGVDVVRDAVAALKTHRLPQTPLHHATDVSTKAATLSSSLRTWIFVVTPVLDEYAILAVATTLPPSTVLPSSLSVCVL
ncbi:hypothetical protein L249_3953 [Ophiocordyceps polyrhachis-furcata BCC 54312]|uniref:ATP phosphoribosyltransferase n=1 Tax=Ophiocordyceps polyrhachis-furcata BCC 54312 TaxID=1330021 RepID=A0A367L5K2_9HYPO|nr:hypothetical protein L249_3953 [Ophiocordyceps polyrhachis-furcata BCC 54312]